MDSYEYHLIKDIQSIVRAEVEHERWASAKDAEMMSTTKPKGRTRG